MEEYTFENPIEGLAFYGSLMEDYAPGLGLPRDPVSRLPPSGLESTTAALGETPMIASIQTFLGNVEDSIEAGVKGVYNKGKDAIGTVYDDVSKPIVGAFDGLLNRTILLIAVLGVALYFIGKSGAVKASISR